MKRAHWILLRTFINIYIAQPFIQQPQFMRFGSSGYRIPHATMGTLSARDAFVGFVFRICCSTASSIACPISCTFVPSLALLGC